MNVGVAEQTTLTIVLSTYAAVVSSVTAFFQVRQMFLDRAHIGVEASMAVESGYEFGPISVVTFGVRAVNTGHRLVRVKKVAAYLERGPDIGGLTPSTSECVIFGARGEQPVELSADGGECSWKTAVAKTLRFERVNREGFDYGTAYVLLTSGKKICAEFQIISDDALGIVPG